MGYGKTTAIKWWEKNCISGKNNHVYHMTVINNNISELWENLCKSIVNDFPDTANKMIKLGFPLNGNTMFLFNEICKNAISEKNLYFIFDDVHILSSEEIVPLLIYISTHLPDSIHIILISRNRIFSQSESMKLGSNLIELSKEDLQLNRNDIILYSILCGLDIDNKTADNISKFTDGWISMIYLIFCNYKKNGKWEYDTLDIDTLVNEIMIKPHTLDIRKFLLLCSVMPEFSEEQAHFVCHEENVSFILEKLSNENAFVSQDNDGIYRFHSLLRRNLLNQFEKLPEDEKYNVLERVGDWYSLEKKYSFAMKCYVKAEKWEKFVVTMGKDRGSSFKGMEDKTLFEWYENCPKEILCEHPETILTFALIYFISDNIKGMLELNKLLLDVIKTDSNISMEERANYEGESQILLGFLSFNNIFEMSRHHRKACELMNRESYLVNHKNPWTFNSPSVLMLYHKKSGEVDKENAEMFECMPYYYKLTDGHGSGAEYSMLAEINLMRGEFDNAEINYYKASRAAMRKKQNSILITAEFTMIRLYIISGAYKKAVSLLENMREKIINDGEFVLIPTLDMCMAWIYSHLEQNDMIPEWIMENGAENNIMSVSKPIFFTLQNSCFIARNEWTRVLSSKDELLQLSEQKHMVMCTIYLHIFHSIAYYNIDKRDEAIEALKRAVDLAIPDKLIVPFAEKGEFIGPVLKELKNQHYHVSFLNEIIKLSTEIQINKDKILKTYFGKLPDYGLTARELEIAELAAKRRTLKEIAEIVNLSENTIKFHLKNVYSKLEITKTARNKRALLEEFFQ